MATNHTVSMLLLGIILGLAAGISGTWFAMNSENGPTSAPEVSKIPIPQPGDAQNRQMVMQTTLRFGEAVNKRDLSGFRDTTANAFRQAFSLERFNLSFRGFIEQSMDLTVVRNLEPAITETNFNSAQGTQRLAGTFPTRPSQLRFDYTFQWEDDSWKVAGIDLAVVPVE